jgi:cytoskeletal protein RodZ
MPRSVGAELRQARERAQLSLPDLSARTKIRASLLAAMEREEFDRLPGGLLTRGFLRAYAREVGLDPEAVVRRYVAEFEPDRLTPSHGRPAPQETEWDAAPAAHARWAFLIPAIPLALATVFFLRVHQPDEVATSKPAAPAATSGRQVDAVSVEQEARGVAPAPAGEKIEAAAAPHTSDHLRLEIHPTAVVWIEAAADGTRVLYELVNAGERRSIDARQEITMRIGDAAAFAYSINGRAGRTLGRPAEVRDIRITHDNYLSFVIRE